MTSEKYQIRFKGAAKQDITSLYNYLKQQFGSQVAHQKVNDLQDSISKLSNLSGLGRDASELSEVLTGYHYLHLTKNTVFYQILSNESRVEILRIYSNRMDVLEHLLSDFTDYDHNE
ncbi:plasmid stabilization system protein, RelE/ParE family [Limosilactobacillus coleohominis 101-4-CHN]|uniref:Plasmid stabilization system protein, RelE/ParE family n=1 Tax=Limosilactobacillus coleohominis 101-4-CHN TaxID=575594 RepID=C7XWZ1_9LACO|nr:type II toxin-antitoxin system RelE/ParE family toxin [Limosilactobacillus coleohominis]EEU29811.1 plasmid stabilization system protein, RelE/ParE family [Limosilactobacillus coleohominis 101-4-CHN]